MGEFTWGPGSFKLEWDAVNMPGAQGAMAQKAAEAYAIAKARASGHDTLASRVHIEGERVLRGEYPVHDFLVTISDPAILSIEYGRTRTRGKYKSERDVAGLRVLSGARDAML